MLQVPDEDDCDILQYHVPDILSHHYSYDTELTNAEDATMPSQQQEGSTIEKSREVLMSDIEKTIEQLVTSILVGEPMKLPLHVRKLTTAIPAQRYYMYIRMHIIMKLMSFTNRKRKDIDSSTQQVLYNNSNLRYLSLSCASSAKTLGMVICIQTYFHIPYTRIFCS